MTERRKRGYLPGKRSHHLSSVSVPEYKKPSCPDGLPGGVRLSKPEERGGPGTLHHTAVNTDDLCGNIPGGFTGQEGRQFSQFFRSAVALERNPG